ncbi:MAG: 2-oxoglutarate dehydrogenase E1 component, partial [Gammaproteobacteria bacterium]|nr:2-oxoglutarate dehydrogenase E1 component [Gammaproteobacteria bacterium]
DPASVPEPWSSTFQSFAVNAGQPDRSHAAIRAQLKSAVYQPKTFAPLGSAAQSTTAQSATTDGALHPRQAAVGRFIRSFRNYGHRAANLDPLGLTQRDLMDDLTIEHYGLAPQDHDQEFIANDLAGFSSLKLTEIIDWCHRLYAGSIGIEFGHIGNAESREWLSSEYERRRANFALSVEQKRKLLGQLTAAEGIERYLHTRYVGQKRFSLEGGESLIPLLATLIDHGGQREVEEIVIGMAHRGRLNVLVNILGKPPKELFDSFEGKYDSQLHQGSGDVKYHLGYSADLKSDKGSVHVVLAFNPSHLEIVNPVVEGSVRARQDRRGNNGKQVIVPVLVHGDAAFAGQGVIMETLQMSETRGFSTGGTVHIICNNQIGFTTSNPQDTRSSRYASDVAKFIDAPIFHVNADDPEAVVLVSELAMEFRQRFNRDVLIDLVCYRRHGHNEADEPAATQPAMYQTIRKHLPARQSYAALLSEEGAIEQTDGQAMVEHYRDSLDQGEKVNDQVMGMIGNKFTVDWSKFDNRRDEAVVDTSVPVDQITRLAKVITEIPEEVNLHPRVARVIQDRGKMAADELAMDWGFAENIAYASLLDQGFNVRLCGQDSGRGTFFHRHAALHNQQDDSVFVPLRNVSEAQRFRVIDSFLSEEAVLGFEYGYASTDPYSLVIWEAQFGDFCNGAQVVIDQFISSGEAKWGRLAGLVMFLPHGQEGQGPEHSSARLERFLQLCAEDYMTVCMPSTPAQMFHLLRRQMLWSQRKPLIVITPKSLLRHRESTSTLKELSDGQFHPVLSDAQPIEPAQVTRAILCSGKVYYDLLQMRREQKPDYLALM